MKSGYIAIPLFFLVLTAVVLFIALLVVNLSGCHDPLISVIHQRYPHCEIMKIEDASFGYQEITIQCPLSPPKTIRMKRR